MSGRIKDKEGALLTFKVVAIAGRGRVHREKEMDSEGKRK
jgi:hypothetical protein